MEETLPPKTYTDVRLQVPQVKKRAMGDTPYFILWVKDAQFQADQAVYIDTSEQQMLYNPLTNSGDYKYNLSIVTKLVYESPDVYSISSVVLPYNSLTVMGYVEQSPRVIYSTIYSTGSSTKFYLQKSPDNDQHFSLYTHMNNDPKQKAYLLPVVDDKAPPGPRQYIIRAIETPEPEQKNNFVFGASSTDYVEANTSATVSSNNFENWCRIF